ADDEKAVAVTHRFFGGEPDFVGQALLEPDDVGAQQLPAARAARQLVEGVGAAIFDIAAAGAAHAANGAVNLQYASAAGGLMQAVHVLRDQGEAVRAETLFQPNECVVSGIGLYVA